MSVLNLKTMKHIYHLLALVISMSALAACGNKDVDGGDEPKGPVVQGICFDKTTLSLEEFSSASVALCIIDNNANIIKYDNTKDSLNLGVVVESSDESIVKVAADGTLNAVASGSAIVVASSAENKLLYAQLDVMVTEKVLYSMQFARPDLRLELADKCLPDLLIVGRDGQPVPYDYNKDSLNLSLKWTSRNRSIVEVTPNGELSPQGEGQTVVKVMYPLDTLRSAELTVEVYRRQIYSMAFEPDSISLIEGKNVIPTLKALDSKGEGGVYDASKDSLNLGLAWVTSNSSVVTVDDNGLCTAVAEGEATVSVSSTIEKLMTASAHFTVKRDVSSTTGITAPLSEDLIYSKNGQLRTTTAVMQCFDVDSKGEVYYAQLNRLYRAYLSHGKPGTKYSEVMILNYFGHVSNFTVEEDGDDRYYWVDNMSSKTSDGNYWNPQIISRVKFVAGTTLNSWEATDNYYFGISGSVAVDFKNDMITILGGSGTYNVNTFRLSEVLAAPVVNMLMNPVKYGGESNNDSDAVEQTKNFLMKVHDASRIKPIGYFYQKRIGDVPWQGFDISDGRFYQAEGGGSSDGVTPSTAYITVTDIYGNLLEERTHVAAVESIAPLNEQGITDTGYMEAEGVKIRGGVMYLGYASKNSADKRYGTILKYKPCDRPSPQK